MIVKDKKVALFTLGCKLNFAETSTIARKFTDKGYSRVEIDQHADVFVINSCSVTEQADRKCKQLIRKIIRHNPDSFIAIVGCYAQLKANEIAEIDGVDLVLGSKEKFNILDYIHSENKYDKAEIHACSSDEIDIYDASFSLLDRTRAFLKVQDGCDYSCTYCTIPLARGKSRNDSIGNILKQVQTIADSGVKEVVLTGVNTGDFGKSTNETFFDLVKELDTIQGIERFRISSIEPNLIHDELLAFINNSQRFVPHFHIPLQSGSNTILNLMKRRYGVDLFRRKVENINNTFSHPCIGVDVIVGFPGETEGLFNETYDFLSNLEISYLHVFPYSERKNTEAINLPGKVTPKPRTERCERLIQLSGQKRKIFYKKNLGTIKNVIFENQNTNELMSGFTDNYIRVEYPYNSNLTDTITKIRLLDINNQTGNVICEII